MVEGCTGGVGTTGFWEYFECGVHVSIGQHQRDRYYIDPEEEDPYHRSNILFGCLTAGIYVIVRCY